VEAVDEAKGAEILRERFTRAGCTVLANVPFDILGKRVHLDGWDAAKKVGFEYITGEAGDRDELTPDVVAELEAMMDRGEVFVFLFDEREAVTAEALALAADRFLEALRARGYLT
jgi:hypothetical protein